MTNNERELREKLGALERELSACRQSCRDQAEARDRVERARHFRPKYSEDSPPGPPSFSLPLTPDNLAALEAHYDASSNGQCAALYLYAPELFRELRRAWEDVVHYKEREAAVCKAVGGVCDGGKYRADIISRLQAVFADAAALKRIEKERLQVTTDHNGNWDVERVDPPAAALDRDLRSAIAGVPEVET